MRFISCHDGKLQHLAERSSETDRPGLATGLDAIDRLAPGGRFAHGAVHELLTKAGDDHATFFAAMLARAAQHTGAIIWCDAKGEVYPPALVDLGIDLSRFYLLRPRDAKDHLWAVAEALRCKGAGIVIASPKRLSRIEARRLQLAAENGRTVGVLLRHTGAGADIYAAATQWLVRPMPGERTVQRWKIQLIHGHGGRVGESAILENCRETRSVRALEKLADRPAATTPETLTA